MRRVLYKQKFEIQYVSPSQAVVRNLAAGKDGGRGEARVSISSAHNYELEDVKVLGPLPPPSIGHNAQYARLKHCPNCLDFT